VSDAIPISDTPLLEEDPTVEPLRDLTAQAAARETANWGCR
jgi:hypothetical protein